MNQDSWNLPVVVLLRSETKANTCTEANGDLQLVAINMKYKYENKQACGYKYTPHTHTIYTKHIKYKMSKTCIDSLDHCR
jgi:hypothetical protein